MLIQLILVSFYAYLATGYIVFKREGEGDESLGEKFLCMVVWPYLVVGNLYLYVSAELMDIPSC